MIFSNETEKLTYADCLQDKAPMPTDHVRLFTYRVLAIGAMCTVMTTINGMRHSGFEYFHMMHWFYPIMLCIALLCRYAIANHLTDFLIPRLVEGRLHGFAATVAKSAINVACMSPFTCLASSILLEGMNFLPFYTQILPSTFLMAVALDVLVVGPAMKIFYHYYIHPRSVTPILNAMGMASCPLTRAFGC